MLRYDRFRIAIAVAVALVWFDQALFAGPNVAELQATYRELSRHFAETQADWRPQGPASGSLLFIAPDEYTPAQSGNEPANVARKKYADALFGLAKQAAEEGQLSLAFQWATEAARENTDHAEARRVLGYEQRDGKWLTPYGVKMFDAGKVWDSKRGWIARDNPKIREVTGQVDAAQHGDIENGWRIRTDHFLVTTDDSLAAGAELAARLERLYQVWRQLFAGFYYTEREVRGLFAGERNARIQIRPFHVFYYRSREEYLEALRRRQPRIAETLGIYFDNVHEAHFFAGDDASRGTLYHEAVHQLFQESRRTARHIGATSNFWIVEGVATYFETLTEHHDPHAGLYYTIGEAAAGRLPSARRGLREGFYIPLVELTRFGMSEVQHHPERAKLYSESSGLAAFLIDGEQSRYREPLVRYLTAVYSGHDNDATLSEATETSYTKLDAEYRQYMESLP